MSVVRRTLAVCLAVLFLAPAVSAQNQNHVAGKSLLEQAVQERVAREQADREAISSLLQRDDVRQIADRAGISLEQAEAAVASLSGADLEEMGKQARAVENELAGGQSAVVISTTTIIIILLLVLLILALRD